jgi:glycerophosphoryl diester phosphodiesterase
MLLISHRGGIYDDPKVSREAPPENTMASFNLAWKAGLKTVELDVQLSKDDQVVVFHDSDTKRMGEVDKKVRDQTLAELRTIDIGKVHGEKWAGERIAAFEEFLQAMPLSTSLFLEVKGGPETVPELQEILLKKSLKPEQITIIGFSIDTVTLAKKVFPKNPVYWLCKFIDKKTGEKFAVEDQIAKVKAAGLDGLNVQFSDEVDADRVKKVKEAGLGFYVWTVDDPIEAKRLYHVGVDGIATNRPVWIKEQLPELNLSL